MCCVVLGGIRTYTIDSHECAAAAAAPTAAAIAAICDTKRGQRIRDAEQQSAEGQTGCPGAVVVQGCEWTGASFVT